MDEVMHTPSDLVVLKSPRHGPMTDRSTGPLPYRIDLLERSGFRLRWTDENLAPRYAKGRLGRVVRRTEAAGTPWLQLLMTRRLRRGAAATVAMFESEGHGLALLRRLRPRWSRRSRPARGGPLVIIACWLADLARTAPPRRLAAYRFVYGAVDRVVVFSENQRSTLAELVGIDPSRILVVEFGIDLDEIGAIECSDTGTVVAAGRDRGRDWPTLVTASAGTGWTVDLVTRMQQVRSLDLPPEIVLHGYVPRDEYLALMARASVVVVPTDVREYPTGQTVLLEAMAMGKACVVTDTPAMSDYLTHDQNAWLVPPGDPVALRAAIATLLADEHLRARLGDAARRWSLDAGGATRMWDRIGAAIHEEIERSRHHDENINTSQRS
jgi:glycosyltransferase involved in cell wall biosynthesis